MNIKKPEGQTTPVFDRGHWMRCPGFEGWRCGKEFRLCKATMCPSCVEHLRRWKTKGYEQRTTAQTI